MASWFTKLKRSYRRLDTHWKSRLYGGEVVETLGTIRGEVKGLGLNCEPTGKIEVHRLRGEAEPKAACVALAFEQKVHFGRGDSAIVVSLDEAEVRALIGLLRRTCPDEGTKPAIPLDRPRSTA